MPIVRIKALPQADVDITAVVTAVAVELAEVLGEAPEGTWATWETIASGHYAEGQVAPTIQPSATHPPLVSVLAFEGRPAELIEHMLMCVADVLVRELRLEPGNVFVTYDEARSGRVYDGGRIVKRG
jgi:phenylpyruvate tautomerase PptA (4-oxalocrotonate tautomerase family)